MLFLVLQHAQNLGFCFVGIGSVKTVLDTPVLVPNNAIYVTFKPHIPDVTHTPNKLAL
jgi:hypothetical protein